MASSVSSSGFSFTKSSVGGIWSWTVLANNQLGVGQTYYVSNIVSPFGRLYDVMIDIPADVALAIADSIAEIQAQLSSAISLLTGTPSSYDVTVTEGAATEVVAVIPFTNSGAFGSFLSISATPGASWLTVNPTSVAGVGKNQPSQVTVSIKPQLLLADDSPYSGSVTLQDLNSSSFVTINVSADVLPRPQIGLSSSDVALTYAMGTNTLGGAEQIEIENTGDSGSVLSFTVAKLQNQSQWLAFTPSSGGPLDSGESDIVTFSLVPGNMPMIPGQYTELVAVASPNALNTPQTITVTLTVTA